jgi:acyl transferase domain-containing protein
VTVHRDMAPQLQKAALVIRELRERLDQAEHAPGEPIAIVGMACRFPGADDPDRYWHLLESGSDAITGIPPEREAETPWRDTASPNDAGVPRFGGFIRDCDCFDAAFFGLTAREAVMTDPQHRLLLESSWHALEDAGLDPLSLRGSETGVFVGIASNDYAQILLNRRDYSAYYLTGNPLNAAAGRLAFTYGLQGPCVALDTACSASLVAVHQACQALRGNECRLALAAGVNLVLLPLGGIILSRAGMLAPDGRCKTLDAAADGYVRGEGCGIVVLKRLSDAVRDGDRVRAVLRGSAVTHGGQSAGFTVPNGAAQRAAIEKALARAKTAPGEVGYVELHGTGTQLGDPIEVRALAAALSPGRSAEHPVVIGSVKSNIGHLEGAAGVAGLIKAALAVEHGRIPATLHVHAPNPDIPWADLPVAIARETRAWPLGPRIAGVSSFGASGTNVHVIVAAAGEAAAKPAPRPARDLELLVISARSNTALIELARRHADALGRTPATDFPDYAATAATARAHLPHRVAVLAGSAEDAAARLRAFADGDAGAVLHGESRHRAKVLLALGLRPPQRLPFGMPVFDRALADCAAQLASPTLPGALAERRLEPALTAVVSLYAMARVWQALGVQPAMLAGRGPGLRVAAVLARALDLRTAVEAPPGAALTLATPILPLFDHSGTALDPGSALSRTTQAPTANLMASVGATAGLWLGGDAPPGMINADDDAPAWPALAQQLAALFVAGVPLEWGVIYPRSQGRRLPLPCYPFVRDRHWVAPAEPEPAKNPATPTPGAHAAEGIAGIGGTGIAAIFQCQLAEAAAALTRIVEQQLAAMAPPGLADAPAPALHATTGPGQLSTLSMDAAPQGLNAPSPADTPKTSAPAASDATKPATAAKPAAAGGRRGPAADPKNQRPAATDAEDLLLLAAEDGDALAVELAALAGALQELPAGQWHEAARQSRLRAAGQHRAMLIAPDPRQAAEALSGNRTNHRLRTGTAGTIRVAYVFPGLGEQHPGMAKGLYDRNAVFRDEIDRLCALAAPLVESDLREVMFTGASPPGRDLRAMLRRDASPPTKAADRLARTLFAHTAILVVELALVRLWQSLGLRPAALAGYSLGEYAAACTAGVMDERTVLELVAARARLIETMQAGGMLAVAAPTAQIVPLLCEETWIAATAAPALTVIGGSEASLAQLCPLLAQRKIVHRRLAAGRAFHTPHMADIAEPYRAILARTELHAPRIPYIGNLTGDWVTPGQATDPDWWVRHAIEPVRFAEALERLLADPEMAVLEAGPGQSLTSYAHQVPRAAAAPRLAVPSLRAANDEQSDAAAFLTAAGRLWLAGAPMDWAQW